MLSATLIDKQQQFYSLKQEWNSLLHISESDSVFLTWEWLHNWWIHFKQNKKLFIVVIRDEHQNLVGIGPFCIKKISWLNIKYLSFLGNDDIVCSDYLDFIVLPNLAQQISQKIISFIYSQKQYWDLLLFANLRNLSFLKNNIKFNTRLVETHVEKCPYILLPNSNEKFLANLGQRTRRNIRNFQRRLNNYGVQFEKVNSQDNSQKLLDILFDLHLKRRSKESLNSTLFNNKLQEFLRSILKDDLKIFNFYTLKHENKIFAILLFFHYNDNLLLYQGGFDNGKFPKNISIITVLLSLCINQAIENGIKQIHFLQGVTDLKKQFSKEYIATKTVICGSGLKFYFYLFLIKLKSNLIKIFKIVLPRKSRAYLKKYFDSSN